MRKESAWLVLPAPFPNSLSSHTGSLYSPHVTLYCFPADYDIFDEDALLVASIPVFFFSIAVEFLYSKFGLSHNNNKAIKQTRQSHRQLQRTQM